MQPDPHLDLFSVFSMLLAVYVGPQYAPALAAYIIIIMGALLGTLPALKNRDPTEKPSGALLFCLGLVTWSCGITFAVSLLIQQYTGLGWKWLLFPVAFAISSFGDKWLQAPMLVWSWGKKTLFAMLPKGNQP